MEGGRPSHSDSDGNREHDLPDWAYLPLPAVLLISQNIKSLPDYVRFRAVCSPWRCASPPKPQGLLPPQLPWLMLPYAPHQEYIDRTEDAGMRLFYDVWESKFRRLYVPESVGMMCCASYRGWLLLVADDATLIFLINPVTRARVDLPPFTTPVKHIWDEDGNFRRKVDHLFKADYLGNFAITKLTFSSDLTHPDCLVMVFVQRAHAIFFCRVGDPCWTEVVRPPLPSNEPADAAYRNGIFYLLGTDSIAFYDLSRHKSLGVLLFNPELQGVTKYFLDGKSGLYLVAVRFIEQKEEEEEGARVAEGVNYVGASEHMVEMYHISDEQMLVKQVTDTNDTAIFYADRNHYLALCADDWDLLEGGSMYMQYKSSPSAGNRFGHKSFSILFAKLEEGKPQPLLVGFGEEPPIFPPAAAMWFQPSFI